MTAHLTKYVIVVDSAKGPLSALAPELHEFGFRVVCLPTPRRALEFLHAFPKLSLVAINGAMAKDGALFVSAAKMAQPGLPIVWLCASEDDEAPSSGTTPDVVVVPPFDAQALREKSATLLREWFYPPPLVAELIRCASEALGAFGTYALAGDPFLKSNRVVAGALTEQIAFSGDHVAGRLVVSCAEPYGRDLYRRVFPEDAQADAPLTRDLLGEIANLTLGRFKEYFERHALPILMGLPSRVRLAPSSLVAEDFDRPTLCIDFEEPRGRIFFEFCFGTFDPAVAGPEIPVEFLKGNEVILL